MANLKYWSDRELDKLKSMPVEKRLEYIWDYYKLWIIGILSTVILVTWSAVHFLTTPGDNWFYACFANTYADLGSDSPFCQGFAEYAGFDLGEKNIIFNAECYCDPTKGTYGNRYYETLVAMMDSGTLDVVVMEQEQLKAIGATGRLLDLEDERLGDFADWWADRLVYVEPEAEGYEKELVPIGVDLQGTILVGPYRAYPDGAVLGISAYAPHYDEVERFLQYIMEAES